MPVDRVFDRDENLSICFPLWILFEQDTDYDRQLAEMAQRGFNCIRFEAGAGLLWDEQGRARTVKIHQPFGRYTRSTTYYKIVDNEHIDLSQRLLRLCAAAKKHGIGLIPSSWFFLHTNWLCDAADKERYFEMSTQEKMTFFGEETGRILSLLRENGFIDLVAFAEIFNEFDGLPFAGEYRGDLPKEELLAIRAMHESEIDKLKAQHPDVLFGYDSYSPWMVEDLIPRNIDVLNYHSYYLWNLYKKAFECGWVRWSTEEEDFPEVTREYLEEKPLQVADILGEMDGDIKTGVDWARRIALYGSIDPEKAPALSKMLEGALEQYASSYRRKLKEGVEQAVAVHSRLVPHARLVMGEGVCYCASRLITTERDSETFWNILKEQVTLLREKGLWGTVVKTLARPGDNSWDACKEKYQQLNRAFRAKE